MRHDRKLSSVTTIRPRKLPAVSATALLFLPLAGLVVFRRDLLIWLGEPTWILLGTILAVAIALTALRLFTPAPLMRISPHGIEIPRMIAAPIRWSDIARIQATTRRSGTGDVHDRLLFHFRQPQTVDWQSSKLQRLFGDTPQAAIAVDIGMTWPCRADDVRRLLHDAARTYAAAPEVQSAAPVRRRRGKAVAVLVVLATAAMPVATHIADMGLPRQFSEALALYRSGDIAAAIPRLERDARAGDREAAHALGMLYLNGDGVTRNTAMAAGWFNRAAEAGHTEAAYHLGNAYRLGLGTPKDIASALTWYEHAADGGSAIAAYTLGTIYRLGDGVRRDYSEALVWLKLAADRKHAPAEHDLGRLYQDGIAVPRDVDAAMRWYSRAAARGHAPARYDLARLMLDGTPQQRGLGLKYLAQAAESGFAPAQRRLAAALFNGQGVPRNAVTAYKWISLAERTWPAATRADLVREKARIAAAIDAEQIEKAKSLIRAWRPNRTD